MNMRSFVLNFIIDIQALVSFFVQHHHEVHICVFQWNVSKTFWWFAKKFSSDIHDPQRIELLNLATPNTNIQYYEHDVDVIQPHRAASCRLLVSDYDD